MNKADFKALQDDGYYFVKELHDGRAICLKQQLYTTALLVIADNYAKIASDTIWNGWERRFCYEHPGVALAAGIIWEGEGDPPGPWVKDKSPGQDRLNPNIMDPMFE